ncbi:hypothetical protein ACFWMG_08300 [Streptomyces sp. NPDC127074]|uniref:hypothetical protein n=1 Tax=Streptomyces sp. NPDC127074 TaxID=3347130 RepID=UPI00365A7343
MVVLLLATGVTAAVLVLEGGHLDLRGAGWALAGRVPGAVGGAALVAVLPARHFFLAGSVMSLAILAATGAVHTYSLWHTALLAPAAAIGVLLARPLSSRMDIRRTWGVAMVLAVASATVLVIQQFV